MSRGEQKQVVERFLAALGKGDMEELMDALAPDVVVIADGGGLAPAAQRPVHGSRGVASLFARFAEVAPHVEITTSLLNGAPGARIDPGGELETAVGFVVENGRIARIYAIRNPQKLERLSEMVELRR